MSLEELLRGALLIESLSELLFYPKVVFGLGILGACFHAFGTGF